MPDNNFTDLRAVSQAFAERVSVNASQLAEKEAWLHVSRSVRHDGSEEEWLVKALAVHASLGVKKLSMEDDSGKTLLALAAEEGNSAAVRLLAPWHDVNARLGGAAGLAEKEETALTLAARNNRLECVKILAEHADWTQRGYANETILCRAARASRPNPEMLRFLASVCDSAAVTSHGRTALHLAAFHHGDPECVKALMEVCPIDAVDQWGNTALTCAVSMNRVEAVKLLWPATREKTTGKGRKPMAVVALSNNALECFELLMPIHDWSARTIIGSSLFDWLVEENRERRAAYFNAAESAAPLEEGKIAVARHGAEMFPLLNARIEAHELAKMTPRQADTNQPGADSAPLLHQKKPVSKRI